MAYPASFWAQQVSGAITCLTNNDYYYDDWEDFTKAFLHKFGIPNYKQHYFIQLTQLEQGKTYWEPFIAEFDRLRENGISRKPPTPLFTNSSLLSFLLLRPMTLGPRLVANTPYRW